jgi:Ca2+-binding RTX toxin-like protein
MTTAPSSQSQPAPKKLQNLLSPDIDYLIAETSSLEVPFDAPPGALVAAPSLGISSQQTVTKEAGDTSANATSANGTSAADKPSQPLAASPLTSLNKILGTNGNDDITGTLAADHIHGLGGDDVLRGDNGNDIVAGGNGNDTISGDHVPSRTTQSDDTLYGNNGDDKLFGRIGDDYLGGGTGDDQLFGGSGADRMSGGDGNDQMFGGIVDGDQSFNVGPDGADTLSGGRGNDYLDGGEGNDFILGTNAVAQGAGEVDVLIGGAGQDTFVLGDRSAVYYTQAGGSQDFAIINDFQTDDVVRLRGNASQYVLGYDSPSNSTGLAYIGGGNFELIGSFANQDLSGLSLTSSAFKYV